MFLEGIVKWYPVFTEVLRSAVNKLTDKRVVSEGLSAVSSGRNCSTRKDNICLAWSSAHISLSVTESGDTTRVAVVVMVAGLVPEYFLPVSFCSCERRTVVKLI